MSAATVATTQCIRTRLVEVFRSYSSGELASCAAVSKRTAEKWRANEAMPTAERIGTMMVSNARLRRQMFAIMRDLAQ